MMDNMEQMENNFIKEEWIDGLVMMSPRPSGNHTVLEGAIANELRLYFKKSCMVSMEGALFLTKENIIELKKDETRLKELLKSKKAELAPDIAVYCDKEQLIKRGFLGIPQLIVEILSPSNSEDDLITKKATYETFGIQEYWIVSPMSKKALVFVLENDTYDLKGTYLFKEELIKSSRFEDLTVDIKDTWWYEEDII
jgi:Uma2 family endonuclease